MTDEKSIAEWTESEARKPYAPPKLSSYGSVSAVTRGGVFIGNEGNTMCVGNANMVMACEVS